ncbi:MAG: hypothetical protein AB7E81_23800 [Hyphomicrobiaceae bacterium]
MTVSSLIISATISISQILPHIPFTLKNFACAMTLLMAAALVTLIASVSPRLAPAPKGKANARRR